ncbi:MAG TPA: HAMP domain-containing sensor histidine kinase [Anaerolineae bacterium]|nr:HAMP domain-containing sensor histidine kinase [Anaerolineae bacterium]HQI83201.1 HAMP domain-containing sensor histidine kinase [Anaerolineae bacterium]
MKTGHSLTLKLTVIVVCISLLSVVLVAVFTRYATVSAFDRMLVEQSRADFIAIVTAYYEQNHTWLGVNEVLREQMPAPAAFVGLTLVDQNGHIVIADPHSKVGQPVSPAQMEKGTAIELNGERIGTLLENAPPPVRKPEDEIYLVRTNRALMISAIGAGALALFLGILGSRTLTRPLRELTAATTAMARGELEQRVPVRTKDELGQLAASFNQMSADLARANTLRRQMTADIAHDLRTPLTVIKGYTEALRDGDLAPKRATFETMYQEAQHLSHLIDDLRLLSLADAGELKLNRRPTSSRELLSQAVAAYLPQAQEAGVALTMELAEDLPDTNVDPERMARVLGNLVINALRYTPAGGRITLSAHPHKNGVLLRIHDTGSGIAPEDLPNIFERFYRGETSRYADHGESGLGLAIVKSLVEAHGGVITVTSAVGQGATFEVVLP